MPISYAYQITTESENLERILILIDTYIDTEIDTLLGKHRSWDNHRVGDFYPQSLVRLPLALWERSWELQESANHNLAEPLAHLVQITDGCKTGGHDLLPLSWLPCKSRVENPESLTTPNQVWIQPLECDVSKWNSGTANQWRWNSESMWNAMNID